MGYDERSDINYTEIELNVMNFFLQDYTLLQSKPRIELRMILDRRFRRKIIKY